MLYYYCKKCGDDAGSRHDMCLECDSTNGVPRVGRKTLSASRIAYEELRRKSRAVSLEEAIEKAYAKRNRKTSSPAKKPTSPAKKSLTPAEKARQLAKEEQATRLKQRKEAAKARRDAKAASSTRPAPPPAFPYGVSPEGAEQLVCDWMRHLGASEAKVTSFRADGGIDVEAKKFIAQVKLYAGNVGRPEIQQLAGVAAVDGRQPLFFTSSDYTPEARNFAELSDVALFTMSPEKGTLRGKNSRGREFLQKGLV